MRDRGPQRARDVVRSVNRDLARTALELLEHGGPSAGGQRKGASGVVRGQRERLLDEEPALWRWRRRLADDSAEAAHRLAVAVDDDTAFAELDDDMPRGRRPSCLHSVDPARSSVR